jgi:hypothetical protein
MAAGRCGWATDAVGRLKPVSFCLVVPLVRNGQQDGQGAGEAGDTFSFGEVA